MEKVGGRTSSADSLNCRILDAAHLKNHSPNDLIFLNRDVSVGIRLMYFIKIVNIPQGSRQEHEAERFRQTFSSSSLGSPIWTRWLVGSQKPTSRKSGSRY